MHGHTNIKSTGLLCQYGYDLASYHISQFYYTSGVSRYLRSWQQWHNPCLTI